MSSTTDTMKAKSEDGIIKLSLEVKTKKEVKATKIGDLSSAAKQFFSGTEFTAEHSINEIVNSCVPLYRAFQMNSPKVARELLKCPDIALDYIVPEKAQELFKGFNALGAAIYYSLNKDDEHCKVIRECVWIMLEKDPNLVNFVYIGGMNPGYTPFMHATARGDVKIMEMILAVGMGADINYQRPDSEYWPGGQTPLHFAVKNGSYEAVVFLLQCGARLDIREREDNATALDFAKEEINPEHTYLIRNRPKIVKAFEDYESLFKACREGDQKRAEELLKTSSCYINQIDSNGDTPLHHAVIGNQKEMVEFLQTHGADVTLKNKNGFTALDLAAKQADKKRAKLG